MKNLNDREKQVELVARFLLDEYKLSEYKIEFRWMKNTLGKHFSKSKIITLSTHFINTKGYDRMLNTILHEIAHALTPLHGHDLVWKTMARKVGAIPRASLNDALFQSEKEKLK